LDAKERGDTGLTLRLRHIKIYEEDLGFIRNLKTKLNPKIKIGRINVKLRPISDAKAVNAILKNFKYSDEKRNKKEMFLHR